MEPQATSRRAASPPRWLTPVSAEGIGAISHDRVAGSCGVSGVTEIKCRDAEAVSSCGEEKPLDRETAARLVVPDLLGGQALDRPGGLPVDSACGLVRKIVGEVRAHEQEGLISIPEGLD